mmetsp:Transcript_1784/g.3862  ORF Transcript_1784/g.3862 Transcript_1784/m.3862 type:complete len:210 (+) Transcript_1784:476-1105(+)
MSERIVDRLWRKPLCGRLCHLLYCVFKNNSFINLVSLSFCAVGSSVCFSNVELETFLSNLVFSNAELKTFLSKLQLTNIKLQLTNINIALIDHSPSFHYVLLLLKVRFGRLNFQFSHSLGLIKVRFGEGFGRLNFQFSHSLGLINFQFSHSLGLIKHKGVHPILNRCTITSHCLYSSTSTLRHIASLLHRFSQTTPLLLLLQLLHHLFH